MVNNSNKTGPKHPMRVAIGMLAVWLSIPGVVEAALAPPANQWVKITPLAETPVSPRLGYEGACVWDPRHQVMIRYGGHNQGGGGEQGSEIWTLDLRTATWKLKEPNVSPPGICCGAQNVFDTAGGRYIRFPSFSGSHGWQWWREIYLNDSSVWTYDLASNTWRNMRPLPAPRVAPLRCASWDSDRQAVLVFGGEGGPRETLAYDPYRNEWDWLKPEAGPEPRSGGQMAYDAAHKVHIMFGSQFTNDPETWIYDPKENQWRAAKPKQSPPSEKNDAVLTYDPLARVVLAMVKISTGGEDNRTHRLETWAYDVGANTWTRMKPTVEPDASGNRARQLLSVPELGLTLLENCTSKPREQQIWLYRHPAAEGRAAPAPTPARVAAPPIVEDAVVTVHSTRQVEVAWPKSADPRVTGYHVERAWVEVMSDDQLTRLKRQTPPLDEPSVGGIRRVGPFKRLTPSPLGRTHFTDTTIDLAAAVPGNGSPIYERSFHHEQVDASGKGYRHAVFAYRVRAVNAAGKESGPSPAVFTIPSSPQWLFSREEGQACHLKWSPNPEAKLRGYRVYRMNGRYNKDPVVRLTADPVEATRYTDPGAGRSTRRYYVVAVDALGQEGFPSSPVWFEREWKKYYEPFVGQWHQ